MRCNWTVQLHPAPPCTQLNPLARFFFKDEIASPSSYSVGDVFMGGYYHKSVNNVQISGQMLSHPSACKI